MPLYRFRSVEELDQRAEDLCTRSPDSAWFARVGRLWESSQRLNPRSFPRGVFRYASIEEAQLARERWLAEHVAALQAARHRS